MKKLLPCAICGERHDELPTEYETLGPVYYEQMSEKEQETKSEMHDTWCVLELDGPHYFVKGILELPIAGQDEPFWWIAWVSLSPENFARFIEKKRPRIEEPMFGWFSSDLPAYPDTVNLKVMVHDEGTGQLPFFELEPTDHPLSIEFYSEMTLAQVHAIADIVYAQE